MVETSWYGVVWVGIVGQLAEVEGRINADQYVDILENHLLFIVE